LYLSDNGSCPYDSNQDFQTPPGPADSYRTLDPKWANLGNTPFRYFKQYGHEGGPRTQLIVNWPARIEPGTITGETGHVVDLLPTLIDAAGIIYPDSYSGEQTLGPDGRSLVPVFAGEKVAPPEFLISGFSERFRMFRQGYFKIVKVNDGDWELYNLAEDPTELHNLAASQTDKAQAMETSYLQKKSELDSRNSDN
jgi:arylsulfatase